MILHTNTNAKGVGYQLDFIWVQVIIQHLHWVDDGRGGANPMKEGNCFLHTGLIPNTNSMGDNDLAVRYEWEGGGGTHSYMG